MMNNKRLPEKCYYAAARIMGQRDFESMPSASELKGQHKFSKEFEDKIKEIFKLFDAPSRKSKVIKRVILIAAIIVLLIIFAIGAVAVRDLVYELFLKHEEDHANGVFVSVLQDDGTYLTLRGKLSIIYEPSFLPKGYREKERLTDELGNTIIYTNSEQDLITLYQETIMLAFQLDTEDTDYTTTEIHGITYYIMEKDGSANITWIQDGYVFRLLCQLSIDESLKIAQSLRPE